MNELSLPENFKWGVSASGFQFEMGDVEEKSLDPNTDWFKWVHDLNNIAEGLVSGDLPEHGVNYWFLYGIDHSLAKGLGLTVYRIGIEWSRIFPNSTSEVEVGVERAPDGKISKIDIDEKDLEKLDNIANIDAVEHYRAIIRDLLEKEFEVIVCLNHFTLPLWIHDPITARNTKLRKGPLGWLDEKTIIEFTKYCAYIAWKLGDLVDWWAIFNEPIVVTEAGYTSPKQGFPPGVLDYKAFKTASINMVIAHARAYDVVKKFDTIKQNEKAPSPAYVGLIHSVTPVFPLTEEKRDDKEAVKILNHIHNRFFLEAVVNGWLDENLNAVKERDENKSYLRNRVDWIGVNYYTRAVVRGIKSLIAKIVVGLPVIPVMAENYGFSCKPNSTSEDGRPTSDFGWEIFPEGLLYALKIASEYGKPILVTENGIADSKDRLRPKFLIEHIKVLERAVNEEKINVIGYLHWALTDNYEWAQGFRMKFGLYFVNLLSKERLPRPSAEVYKKIIEENGVTPGLEVYVEHFIKR
ncbi:MAG: glycoside hydrolase family 1 protein [Thermoprotei archaeon]|nr:MAG: glycoside hydrolase family 1 protein [Thermoprotei archaeon]